MTLPQIQLPDKRTELTARVLHIEQRLNDILRRDNELTKGKNAQGGVSRKSSHLKAERRLLVCTILRNELVNEPDAGLLYVEETVIALERQLKL